MGKLYLVASQTEKIPAPYTFPMTGIRVYSLEEALFHCLHHWRQSVDVICEPFILWVETQLGLGAVGARLREISRIDSFSTRFLAFLTVTDYLPKEGLAALQRELGLWERRQAWEKLAEQGDYWIGRGEGARAYALYLRALNYWDMGADNVKLLNNAGVALMHIGSYDEAAANFAKALRLDWENAQLRFNLIEALIFAGDGEAAQEHIEEAAVKSPEHHELYYFQGELHFHNKNYFEAIKLYEKALELKYDPDYIYKLCDCFMRIRLYDKALATIQTIKEHDITFLRKQAEYFATAQNIPMAIKSIEKALLGQPGNGELWAVLAQYHRLDYDLVRANRAITRALALDGDNQAALLEQARIRKAQGRTKEYQGILNRILAGFKKDYREQRI